MDELIGFLKSPREDVKSQALAILASVASQQLEALEKLPIGKVLVPLMQDPSSGVVCAALKCLVNLSESAQLQKQLIEAHVIDECFEHLRGSEAPCSYLVAMLLGNLSRHAAGAHAILQIGSNVEGLRFLRLLELFVLDPIPFNSDEKSIDSTDSFQFLANVFVNLSQLVSARRILFDEKRRILHKLILYFRSANKVRRLGIMATFRNLLFHSDYHRLLLDEVGLLQFMLEPLIGAEDCEKFPSSVRSLVNSPEKKREADPHTRKLLLEMIAICVRHKPTRLFLRGAFVYGVLRNLHIFEQQNNCTENDAFIEDLIPLFVMDEDNAEQGDVLTEKTQQLTLSGNLSEETQQQQQQQQQQEQQEQQEEEDLPPLLEPE